MSGNGIRCLAQAGQAGAAEPPTLEVATDAGRAVVTSWRAADPATQR